jgi:hypothetical protein
VVTAAVVCADPTVLDINNDKRGIIIINVSVLIGMVISCHNTNFNPWIYTYKAF